MFSQNVNTVSPRAKTGDRVSSHEQIMAYVRRGIGDRQLKPGMQLALREEVKKQFGASAVTVQRAFSRLSEEGFVTSRGSLGTFVAERPPNLYRIAVVPNVQFAKSEALANKFCIALLSAAATYNETSPLTLAPYYGVTRSDGLGDRDRLADDLANDRCGGLICMQDSIDWSTDPALALDEVPAVFSQGGDDSSPYSGVVFPDLQKRMVKEVARLGGRRVAVLALTQADRLADELARLAAAAGLEVRSSWLHAIDRCAPRWTIPVIRNLFSLPDDQRPDSLIVADDHLAEHAVMGLAEAGMTERVKTVIHANFPLLSQLPGPAARVGIDTREVIAAAAELVVRMRTLGRDAEGRWPKLQAVVPVKADYELAGAKI